MDIFIKTMGCKTGNNAVTERMHGRAKAKVVTYYKALLTPNIFYMCISVRFLPNQKIPRISANLTCTWPCCGKCCYLQNH